MPGLGAILWSALALNAVVTLALLLYLDLRLHALKQSGDLPASTPRLFGLSRGFSSVGQTIDLPLLYSRRYRLTDRHTRLFVPILRVTLPLFPILLVLAVLA
ncbi:hypothetical protein GGQ87_001104 [Brevundimonas alba]|uniref:Uncharacterized protein n=1 Tax=Brevundimonas alba TaxID=74314 RepID=A0A7X5YKE5_9CAUL|nr:hypothetical protein [Brevundimonas alba]NJC40846.1 hypothetical protein [Brevundimonas alba]